MRRRKCNYALAKRLRAEGLLYKQIAYRLGVSMQTVWIATHDEARAKALETAVKRSKRWREKQKTEKRSPA